MVGLRVMRDRVLGMQQTDIHILEHLHNEGREIIDRPSDVAVNIGFAVGSVRQRMPVLRRVGLIQHYDADRGQYEITDLGRRYLAGELTNEEIEALENEL